MSTSTELEVCDAFFVDPEALLPGDVLLTTNPKSPFSFAIRKATGSPYSHAILCTDPPMCVEAVGHGVLRFVISQLLIQEKDNLRVLRLRNHEKKFKKVSAAAKYAESKVTSEYANLDMLSSWATSITSLEKNKYFCSHLVAESYEKAGITLVKNRKPKKVSPGDIARSSKLKDISTACVRPASSDELLGAVAYLDGESITTPHVEEVKLKQKIIKDLTPLLSRCDIDATTYDDLLAALTSGWDQGAAWVVELDQAFSEAIARSGLLSLVHKHVPPHHGNYFLDCFLTHLAREDLVKLDDLKALQKRYRKILDVREPSIRQTEQLALAARRAYAWTGLETIRLNTALLEENQAVKIRQASVVRSSLAIVSKMVKDMEP